MCFIVFIDELLRGTKHTRRSIVPHCKEALRLGSLFFDTKSKKVNGGGDRFIDEELFIDEKKLSSMTVPDAMLTPKMHLNIGEHTLIPITVKMIHSAVITCVYVPWALGREVHLPYYNY